MVHSPSKITRKQAAGSSEAEYASHLETACPLCLPCPGCRARAESRFSFANFYLRRILRIAPAYFVVVLASLAAGC